MAVTVPILPAQKQRFWRPDDSLEATGLEERLPGPKLGGLGLNPGLLPDCHLSSHCEPGAGHFQT